MSGGQREFATQSGTNIQTAEPWSGAAPFLRSVLGTAFGDPGDTGSPYLYNPLSGSDRPAGSAGIAGQPFTFYPGSTVVPFAPESEIAFQGQTAQALQGQPLLNQAGGLLSDTMGGDYLNQLELPPQVTDAVASSVLPSVATAFGNAGRFGSPLMQEAASRGMARGLAPYIVPSYQAERDRMQQAATLAPGFEQAAYLPMARLGEVGAAREQQAQMQLNEQIARHEFAQMEPWRRLMMLANLAYPQAGFGGTTTGDFDQMARGPRPGIGAGILGNSMLGMSWGASMGSPMGGGWAGMF